MNQSEEKAKQDIIFNQLEKLVYVKYYLYM